MSRRGVLLALVLATVAGCGGGAGRAIGTTTSEPPTTTERQIPSRNTTTTERRPPTTTTTTAPEPGLPDSFPVPSASIITLGDGSSISTGFAVYAVPLADVRAWLLENLTRAGYTVTGDDGARTVSFESSGAAGTAVLTEGEGVVEVEVTLGPGG